jgi:hypothetical protein
MPAITNIKRLKTKLERLQDKYKGEETPSVVVGYTANYAVYVHERPAKHAPGKQMKFLEQPARQLSNELGNIVKTAIEGGSKLLPALYIAGQRLQRESQEIVPIDTGNLKGSAFTAKEDELMSVIAASESKFKAKIQSQQERKLKKRVAVNLKREKRKAKVELKSLKKAMSRSQRRLKKYKKKLK